MRNHNKRISITILSSTDSSFFFHCRKVFRGLLALSRHDHKVLSRNIAINPHSAGFTVPDYSHARRIADRDELAKSISKWSTREGEDIKLNGSQWTAMNKSFSRSFQLIQGPPRYAE